jgi:hypothetical protein
MSSTESDDIKALEAKHEYLKEWLDRYRKAQYILPHVQMQLDITEWELNALSNRPEEASEIPSGGLTSRWNRDNDYLTDALPLMPDYDVRVLINSTAFTTEGSASVYEYVARVGDLGTPNAITYSNEYTTSYRVLQASQERPKAIRQLLEQFRNEQTLERFDRASKAYLATKSGVGERTAAALEMRTFLDGVKGDLFAKARQQPNENMHWARMAERLAINGPSGIECQVLLSQASIHSSLINRLSQVAKDREGQSVTNLDNIWTQMVDFAYTVLGLIDFRE